MKSLNGVQVYCFIVYKIPWNIRVFYLLKGTRLLGCNCMSLKQTLPFTETVVKDFMRIAAKDIYLQVATLH